MIEFQTCPSCGGEPLTSGYNHRSGCPQMLNITYTGNPTYSYAPSTIIIIQKLDAIIELLTKLVNREK